LTRELRDISEMEEPDMAAIQRKISAGGEMKTSIKRFMDDWDKWETDNSMSPTTIRRRVREMRKAMEAWCNV